MRRSSKRSSDSPLSPPPSSSSSIFRKSKNGDTAVAKKKTKLLGTTTIVAKKDLPSVSTVLNSKEIDMDNIDNQVIMALDKELEEIQLIEEQQRIVNENINSSLTVPPSNIATPIDNIYTNQTTTVPMDTSISYLRQEHRQQKGIRLIMIVAPGLNQIISSFDNTPQIQQSINRLKAYLDKLQKNINGPTATSLKNYMIFEDIQENRIDYQEIMLALLRHRNVKAKNFYKFSEAIKSYYYKCFDSIVPIAHVIVNVNYTRDRTKIAHSLTHFFNLCVHYVVSSINILLTNTETAAIQDKFIEHIKITQEEITNMYNFRLLDLHNVVFYKHTPDNDENRYESYQASLPSDIIYDMPITVQLVSNYLSF